jgi:hypothetical protein
MTIDTRFYYRLICVPVMGCRITLGSNGSCSDTGLDSRTDALSYCRRLVPLLCWNAVVRSMPPETLCNRHFHSFQTMANWFYYNENGEKISVTGSQLKELAKSGLISRDTIVETAEGKSGPARRVLRDYFLWSSPSSSSVLLSCFDGIRPAL